MAVCQASPSEATAATPLRYEASGRVLGYFPALLSWPLEHAHGLRIDKLTRR